MKGIKRLLDNLNKKGCFITVLTYYDRKNLLQTEGRLECEFSFFDVDEETFINDKLPYNLIAVIDGKRVSELKEERKLFNQRKEAAKKLKELLIKEGVI